MTEENIYGQKDGYYITPYNATIFYHENSMFENVLAHLFPQVQVMSIDDGISWRVLAQECEHPSPEVIIFNELPAEDQLEEFFRRGSSMIHILADNAAKSHYKNSNIVVFSHEDLHDHLPKTWFAQLLVLEYLLCAEYPKYVSHVENITHAIGKHFITGLRYLRDPVDEVIQIISTASCEDRINNVVIAGKTRNEIKSAEIKTMMSECIPIIVDGDVSNNNDTSANKKYKLLAINNAYHDCVDINILKTAIPPNVDAVMLYGYIRANTWRVMLVFAPNFNNGINDLLCVIFADRVLDNLFNISSETKDKIIGKTYALGKPINGITGEITTEKLRAFLRFDE